MVEQVRVSEMATFGIYVGPGSLVRGSVSNNNGSHGIVLDCPASAVGNAAIGNVGLNISTIGSGCVLSQNVAPPS